MKNQIYISTGAFTGIINDRNYKLAIKYKDKLNCDGFEFMMCDSFYSSINQIITEYKQCNLNIPVLHTEKQIGELIGSDKSDFEDAKELFKLNCEIANKLGCKKAVLHAWGYPSSNKNPESICERVTSLLNISKQLGVCLLVENIMCLYGDPLPLLEKIYAAHPDIHFIIDTRHAQFHRELEKTLNSSIMKNVLHIHINDFSGGYKEWDKKNPIPQPGMGDVDWAMFFNKLAQINYSHSVQCLFSQLFSVLLGVNLRKNCGYFHGYFYLQRFRVLFMYLNFSYLTGINIISENILLQYYTAIPHKFQFHSSISNSN